MPPSSWRQSRHGAQAGAASGLDADDIRFVDPAQQPAYQDVLVQHHATDRRLSLLAANRDNNLHFNPAQQSEWDRAWATSQKDFAIQSDASEAGSNTPVNVSIIELRRFLKLPAQASLRRHLHIEEDEAVLDEDEPLVTSQRVANNLARQSLQQLVLASAGASVDDALKAWPARFADAYADARLCSRVPEEAFGEIDQAAMRNDLSERIHGPGGIEGFLREHAAMTFCGPVLLGESLTPIGAKLRFPALRLRPGHELPADAAQAVRISGSVPFAWPLRRFSSQHHRLQGLDGRVCEPMFEPLLLYLALLLAANERRRHRRAELAGRPRVRPPRQLSRRHRTWNYPRLHPSAEAVHYRQPDARSSIDAVRLAIRRPCPLARPAADVAGRERAQMAPRRFAMLEGFLRTSRDPRAGAIPTLVDMVHARVGRRAAKVRRRFPLLDRGPDRRRRMPAGRCAAARVKVS